MAFRLRKDVHTEVRENLSAYIDGELDPRTSAFISDHIATCHACAEEKRTLEQTRRLLAEAPRVSVPRSFVLRSVDVEAPAKQKRTSSLAALYLRTATAAVGVLLAAVVAGDVWVRPALMPAAAPQPVMTAFGAGAAEPTEGISDKSAVSPTAAPAPTSPPMVAAAPAPAAEGTGAAATEPTPEAARAGNAEPAPEVATQQADANEWDGASAPLWTNLLVWRGAEAALGLMLMALIATVVIGARRGALHP